jgi:hypothetical protein
MNHRLLATSLAALCIPTACGDVAVRVGTLPTDERPLVCRSLPSDQPSPVKLLVALDTSGSMAFTDQAGLRYSALADYMASVVDTPNLFVHAIGFDDAISSDGPGFAPVSSFQTPTFTERAGVQTDHQGLLEEVHAVLLADMLAVSDEERARTRYVVTILTDGGATPLCCNADDEISDGTRADDSCPAEPWDNAPGFVTCDGETEQAICNDAALLDRYRVENPGTLASLAAGGDRNRGPQLRAGVEALLTLGRELDAGDVDVNAALLFDPTLPDDVKEIFRLSECRLERTATLLDAEREPARFDSAAAIDFAIFEARPICESLSGACKAICVSSLPQLQDEFGVPSTLCDDDAFDDAGDDCAACEAAFADNGVDAAVCAE